MDNKIEGKVFYCKDYTDTDIISPGRFDPLHEDEELKKIALIDYPGPFKFYCSSLEKSPYKFIVAGKDFGCGSSRETAPMALYAAGLRVVVAKSFARIFFRNCINMGGVLPIAIPHMFEEEVQDKQASLYFNERKIIINDKEYEVPDYGDLEPIIKAGSLANYIRARL